MENFLRRVSVLSVLPESELATIVAEAKSRTFLKGDVILRQGEFCQHLMIVRRGRVKIVKHGVSGRDTLIELVEKGEILGTVAMIRDRPLPATALALEETEVIFIPKTRFEEICRRYPEVVTQLMGTVTRRLVDAHESIQTMAMDGAEYRIAKTLLALDQRRDKESEGCIRIARKELAEMTGLTVETTIRVIGKLKEKGAIEPGRGEVRILDKALLSKSCGGWTTPH